MPNRLIPIAMIVLAASTTPVLAEVTHHFSGRFGVSYSSGQNGAPGTTQPLYEGSYTARFSHESDAGVRFRFDLGIVMSNFDSPRPPASISDRDRR